MPMPALEVNRFLAEVGDSFVPIHETRLRWLVAKGNQLAQKVPAGDFDQAAQVWSLIGLARGRLGDQEEALRCHRAALRLRPQSASYANNVGASLIETGAHAEGIDFLVQSYENGGRESVATLANLAEAFDALGQRDDAMDALREAARVIDVTDPSDVYGLCQGAAVLELDDDAVELYARALALRARKPIGDAAALDFIASIAPDHPDELRMTPGGRHVLASLERARRLLVVRQCLAGVSVARGVASEASDRSTLEILHATSPWRSEATAAALGAGG